MEKNPPFLCSEFLKNDKNLFPYNCEKKVEFIKKGIAKSRNKSKEGATTGWFAKFPQDVIRCEKMTGGDVKILEKEPFVEKPVEKVTPRQEIVRDEPVEKGTKRKGGGSTPTSANASPKKRAKGASSEASSTPSRPISHPRFKPGASEQHQVRIMQQPSTPYHLDLQKKEENKAASSQYKCHMCGFEASRLNVLILHTKSHR